MLRTHDTTCQIGKSASARTRQKDARTRGKAYYANKETKETRWDEPESFRTFRLDVDAGIFTGDREGNAIGKVVKPLRFFDAMRKRARREGMDERERCFV